MLVAPLIIVLGHKRGGEGALGQVILIPWPPPSPLRLIFLYLKDPFSLTQIFFEWI